MLKFLGFLIFIIIIIYSVKTGNPNNYIQKNQWEKFINEVVYEMNKFIKKEDK